MGQGGAKLAWKLGPRLLQLARIERQVDSIRGHHRMTCKLSDRGCEAGREPDAAVRG